MGLRPEDLERGAVYRRRWLLENGMHPRHLSSPGMTRVLPTCYTRSEHPADLRRVVLAAQDLLVVPSAVCGVTAAELFGMRLPHRVTRAGGAAVHLEVERGSAPRRTALLVVHRRAPSATLGLHGVTMVEPLIALQQIASRLTLQELVVAVDSLVADRYGTVQRIPLLEVRQRAEHARGRGAARLRAAVAHARERVWSPRETHMHLMLRNHGWPPPALNHEIVDPATGIVYYVDLAYPDRRIAIEYDGSRHVTDPDRVTHDHHKSAVLHAQGWTVLRVHAKDLHDPTDVFARLDHAWAARAARHGDAVRAGAVARGGGVERPVAPEHPETRSTKGRMPGPARGGRPARRSMPVQDGCSGPTAGTVADR